MNGNRWIGTGHNSVFVDEAGQWWTVYHAVDQEDPFFDFATGFTKRPALLDPVDWVDGWPTVNGGAWASDTTMPAPAAQEGQRSRYRTKLVKPQNDRPAPRRATSSAGARSTATGPGREGRAGDVDRLRRPAAVGGRAHRPLRRQQHRLGARARRPCGRLRRRDEGAAVRAAGRGLLLQLRPGRAWSSTSDDDNFVKLAERLDLGDPSDRVRQGAQPGARGLGRYGNTVVGPPGDDWTYLRIVVERLTGAEQREAGGDTERYTAYTSQDGMTWVRGGVWTHSLGDDARDRARLDGCHRPGCTPHHHGRVRLRPRLLPGGWSSASPLRSMPGHSTRSTSPG